MAHNRLSGEVLPELTKLQQVKQLYLQKNCVKIKIEENELQRFLEEIDSSTRMKRHGCVAIEQEAGLR